VSIFPEGNPGIFLLPCPAQSRSPVFERQEQAPAVHRGGGPPLPLHEATLSSLAVKKATAQGFSALDRIAMQDAIRITAFSFS